MNLQITVKIIKDHIDITVDEIRDGRLIRSNWHNDLYTVQTESENVLGTIEDQVGRALANHNQEYPNDLPS